MNHSQIHSHGAARAAQLRKEADTARLLAETYTTEDDLANLARRFVANARRALARRIARLTGRIEPATTEAPAMRRRPARTTA